MGKVNFYLKNKYSSKETPILIYLSYHNRRLRMSTGMFIRPGEWNFNLQRPEKSHQFFLGITIKLNLMEEELYKIYMNARLTGKVDKMSMKQKFKRTFKIKFT